ncbi:MAG: glucosaminidase domain-containing protein [Coriobacteriales bacterium]|jgi:beta-N-acetylglucosaminidase/putative cell wall-binding protein|nr:glucosaminidase domain-containing protein [Coriobacteriales bacterium]
MGSLLSLSLAVLIAAGLFFLPWMLLPGASARTSAFADTVGVVQTFNSSSESQAAALMAGYGWTSSTYAIICHTGAGYDTIAASALAGKLSCPVLTSGKGKLSSATAQSLNALKVSKVVVFARYSQITKSVQKKIAALAGVKRVTRISPDSGRYSKYPNDRYGNAWALFAYGVDHSYWSRSYTLVANGTNYAEAVALAPFAYRQRAPLVYTKSGGDLPAKSKTYLKAFAKKGYFKKLNLLLGSNSQVKSSVSRLFDRYGKVKRFSGGSRYLDSALFSRYAAGFKGIGWNKVALALGSGKGALWSIGALQGRLGAPVVLVSKYSASGVADTLAKYAYPHIKQLNVAGPSSLIAASTISALQSRLGMNRISVQSYPISLSALCAANGKTASSAANPANYQFNQSGYYQFAVLSDGYSGLVSAAKLNSYLATKTKSSSTMRGLGQAIVDAAKASKVNEVYILAHAALESGWGTSTLAKGYAYDGKTKVGSGSAAKVYPKGTYYNFFGIGAIDSSPLSGGRSLAVQNGWNSPYKALVGGIAWIAKWYIQRAPCATNGNDPQNTLYKMRFNPGEVASLGENSHGYATGSSWSTDIGATMATAYRYFGLTMGQTGLRFQVPAYLA